MDAKVDRSTRGHARMVCHADDLPGLGCTAQARGNRLRRGATQASVDLVEDQGFTACIEAGAAKRHQQP